MAYDEGLAHRVQEFLGETPGLVEKKMFGGIGFMVDGNLACGVIEDWLIVRVGKAEYEDALAMPHTKVFDTAGRPMRGWVMVGAQGYEADDDLHNWVRKGLDLVATLPPK